jgi:hypothetical protein
VTAGIFCSAHCAAIAAMVCSTGEQTMVTAVEPALAQETFTPAEARAIAKEAYIYGFPMVDNYRVEYFYFVDASGPEFKATWNHIDNTARVYTPDDKAIQTPNSDTPYSQLGIDLRAEPIVITVPVIEKNRYFSVQLIDYYTFNFDYIGSRTTGNDGGNFLVAGPNWKGEKPKGITRVFQSETELGFALYRTQLFNPSDIENVKRIQAGYKVQTLSQFLGTPAPNPAPVIDFIKPLTREQQRTSPEFFNILNFTLQFCPTVPSEKELRARFAKLGIAPGKTFDAARLTPEVRQAVTDGMADAWKEFAVTDLDCGGAFYTPTSGGYRVISPPIGATTATLPSGAVSQAVNGATYFSYGGAYYRPYYGGSGVSYQVVARPA